MVPTFRQIELVMTTSATSDENARVKVTKNAILAGFIVAFPGFVFLLFCSGFLPVAAMAVFAGRLVASRDPASLALLVPLVLEASLYVFLLNKLANVVTRYVHRDRRRGGAILLTLLIGCVAWTALPVNTFDCMDGHAAKRCSALRMYFGWMRGRPAGTSLYVEAQCGDFGW
jgi:hypothetical protein